MCCKGRGRRNIKKEGKHEEITNSKWMWKYKNKKTTTTNKVKVGSLERKERDERGNIN